MNINSMRYKFIFSVILAIILILFIHLTNNILTQQNQSVSISRESNQNNIYNNKIKLNKISFDEIINNKKQFNISNNLDLFVLLHIQKTGGTTFEKHLVQDLDINPSCLCSDEKRRCSCFRNSTISKNYYYYDNLTTNSLILENTWLLSRFSTGWICGLHADWTQLNNCFNQEAEKNLYFLTFIRNPIHRFISEFRHVQRGATWKNSRKHCENYDTQYCYKNKLNWLNVSLEEFSNCSYNMAINRQTRMLANHNMLKCSLNTNDEDELLASAKDNLKNMAFFGICDEQLKSQFVFEQTFNLKFKKKFKQSDDSKAKLMVNNLSKITKNQIIKLNHLDVELYKFAIDLFNMRINHFYERLRKKT